MPKKKRPINPLCAAGIHAPFVDENGKCIRCHKKIPLDQFTNPLAFLATLLGAFMGGVQAGITDNPRVFNPHGVNPFGEYHAPWRRILGFEDFEAPLIREVNTRYRQLAKKHHPDKGGDPEKFKIITAARDAALKELGA